MTLKQDCVEGRDKLPTINCSYVSCPWYIHGDEYCNCFWVLSHEMKETGKSFSIQEIARLEGITEKEVEEIIEEAIRKIRFNPKFKNVFMNIKK